MLLMVHTSTHCSRRGYIGLYGGSWVKAVPPVHSGSTIMKRSAFLYRPGTRLPCVPLPDPRMEDYFSPPMPYTLGYSATSKSTDSQASKSAFPDFHGNRLEFSDSVFTTSLSDPHRLSVCNFVEIGRKSRE